MDRAHPVAVPPSADAAYLARIVCETCWAHFRSWAAWPGIAVHVESDVTWTEAPIPHIFFNQVYGARFGRGESRRRIATMVSHARHLNVPLIWRVGADSAPENLGSRLEEGGFSFGDEAVAMAMDLQRLEAGEDIADHVTIESVRDDATLREWNEIGLEGFEFPNFAGEPSFQLHRAIGLDTAQPHQHFVARIDGVAVGMATLTIYCGVATLQNLATRAAYRRRGIGTALTRHAMREGRKRGFLTGVLQASPMGRGVYRDIGFRDVGIVSSYLLDVAVPAVRAPMNG
ncbi:MAG: GNAT family N-acetyltransferase [Proteobacteria bacterium]|nr:GNAT family N-acetyltransferase [Pseudomonadota bacterium]MDA1058694.1 GNAT family N-acetyltransferase [Pseudomonadota bacterium]